MLRWRWETVNPGQSTTSGDIAKLFKNEAVKQPGVLGDGAPPVDATLLAREAIQNSWDAGTQLATELREAGREPPKFRLRFVYHSYVGQSKADLAAALDLVALATRSSQLDRRKLGLADQDALLELDDPTKPLRVLQLIEQGTTGMDGPWTGPASKLFLAMVSLGFTEKAERAGGSYGYGKGGLIRGSRIRTVVAHTCFRERPDDPGVTRRALGMTYWGTHGDASEFTGFARLGADAADGLVEPLVNDAADQLANNLHISLRNPAEPRELGSTFLLVDPTVEPDDLRIAVERSWWPAIVDEDCDFDVWIDTEDGHRHIPRPKSNDVLRTFISGYELALTAPDDQLEASFRKDLGSYQPVESSEKRRLGAVGLTADLASWSYAHGAETNGDGNIDHQSLVALVRGPHMVVEYYPVGRHQPYVRGTFVADVDVDDLLRQTEPKAHDAWLDKQEEEGINPLAPKYAKELLRRLRAAVLEFRKQLKRPPLKAQDIRLPLLDDLFRNVLENRGTRKPPPPPPDPRVVGISLEQHVEAAGTDAIRIRARVGMHLTENHAADSATCRLAVRVAFDEDGHRGDDCPVRVLTPPEGFDVDDHVDTKGTVLRGSLTHDWITFDVVSDEYDPDWTAQLLVSGEPLDAPEAEEAYEETGAEA
jgi:hypothetical protein